MWPNPQETADLVTFTEEILNRKLQFFGQCTYYQTLCQEDFQMTRQSDGEYFGMSGVKLCKGKIHWSIKVCHFTTFLLVFEIILHLPCNLLDHSELTTVHYNKIYYLVIFSLERIFTNIVFHWKKGAQVFPFSSRATIVIKSIIIL